MLVILETLWDSEGSDAVSGISEEKVVFGENVSKETKERAAARFSLEASFQWLGRQDMIIVIRPTKAKMLRHISDTMITYASLRIERWGNHEAYGVRQDHSFDASGIFKVVLVIQVFEPNFNSGA